MDPPPLPYHATTIIPIAISQQNYSDFNSSSPRSRHDDTWRDEPLSHVPGANLRLMCSYGGHIMPRPHDKSLCYVGGDNRVVMVDRHSSLSDLHARLSHTLLNGRGFTLRYQLPNQDLDSLVSVTTNEDMEIMFEEYDRAMASSPLKPSRLRLFLFVAKPETAASMGCLLDDANSESWFLDSIKNSSFLSRGVSDSASIDNFLSTTSSFDQSSLLSIPSIEKLTTIKVGIEDGQMNARLQDQILGLDEQFSHISVDPKAHNLDDEFIQLAPTATPPPLAKLRKPPLTPLQPLQRKIGDGYSLPSPDSKHYNLPSPDSVASDTSIASAASLSKHTIYQDSSPVTSRENRVTLASIDSKNTITDQNSQIQMQQVQDSVIISAPQLNQQQQPQLQTQPHFNLSATAHYIHTATGPVTIPSYYTMYVPQSQQQLHQQMDQQCQIYLVSVPQNLTPQSNIADSTAYKEAQPPSYTTKIVTSSQHEMAANVYRNVTQATPMVVQVPSSSQFQQQYYGISQAAVSSATSANFGYEYSHPTHDQMYYAQHPASTFHSQYQTMTPTTAVLFSQASAQLAEENTTAENRTS